jgi:hypothetical protein
MSRVKPQWRQATPYRHTWTDHAKDVGEILIGLVILLILFMGLPFLLWLSAS